MLQVMRLGFLVHVVFHGYAASGTCFTASGDSIYLAVAESLPTYLP
jgi:hypothetical protein